MVFDRYFVKQRYMESQIGMALQQRSAHNLLDLEETKDYDILGQARLVYNWWGKRFNKGLLNEYKKQGILSYSGPADFPLRGITKKVEMVKKIRVFHGMSWKYLPETHIVGFIGENYPLFTFDYSKDFVLSFTKLDSHWIAKNSWGSCGKWVHIVPCGSTLRKLDECLNEHFNVLKNDREFVKKKLRIARRKHGENEGHKKLNELIIQRYIMNPLLLDGRKFDCRVYALIASTNPTVAFWHHGAARLCAEKYDNENLKDTIHLSNQAIQKREDMLFNWKRLIETLHGSDFVNANIEENSTFKDIRKYLSRKMKDALSGLVDCVGDDLDVDGALHPNLSQFFLVGVDLMFSECGDLSVLEVNARPCVKILRKATPNLVKNMTSLVCEIAEKKQRGEVVDQSTPLGQYGYWKRLNLTYQDRLKLQTPISKLNFGAAGKF